MTKTIHLYDLPTFLLKREYISVTHDNIRDTITSLCSRSSLKNTLLIFGYGALKRYDLANDRLFFESDEIDGVDSTINTVNFVEALNNIQVYHLDFSLLERISIDILIKILQDHPEIERMVLPFHVDDTIVPYLKHVVHLPNLHETTITDSGYILLGSLNHSLKSLGVCVDNMISLENLLENNTLEYVAINVLHEHDLEYVVEKCTSLKYLNYIQYNHLPFHNILNTINGHNSLVAINISHIHMPKKVLLSEMCKNYKGDLQDLHVKYICCFSDLRDDFNILVQNGFDNYPMIKKKWKYYTEEYENKNFPNIIFV